MDEEIMTFDENLSRLDDPNIIVMSKMPPSMIPIASQLIMYDEAYRFLDRGVKTDFLSHLFNNFISQNRRGRMDVINFISGRIDAIIDDEDDDIEISDNENMNRIL